MRSLPDLKRALPDLEAGRRMIARLIRVRDVPEPVAAWRSVPEASLAALTVAEKLAFVEALLPLVRRGRKVNRQALRRIYQLFAFMEMPDEARIELLAALHGRLRPAPERLPEFHDKPVRRALLAEGAALAGRKPPAEAKDYLARLTAHLKLKPGESRRWVAFFDHLTDVENRVAALMGKKGHLVRIDDRRLEIVKKAVASVGLPVAILFPLGTIGLSAEGLTTGLVALGGGFLLPASVAMVTGLGVAVALGISTKKVLDLVIPTTDADRFSIDAEKLHAGTIEIEQVLDAAVNGTSDRRALDEARNQVAAIIRRIMPISEADRVKIAAALEHARILGGRYIAFLTRDHATLEERNQIGAEEVGSLLELDRPAMI